MLLLVCSTYTYVLGVCRNGSFENILNSLLFTRSALFLLSKHISAQLELITGVKTGLYYFFARFVQILVLFMSDNGELYVLPVKKLSLRFSA
jgi:hypothetical protein